MRALFAVAVFALGLAGLGAAEAADVSGSGRGVAFYHVAPAVRAPQLLIYDDEPGVYLRSYWATPWQNRRYYPFTGKKPKVGRHERLLAKYPAPKKAESFYREWSTISLFPPAPVYVAPARRIEPPLSNFGPLP